MIAAAALSVSPPSTDYGGLLTGSTSSSTTFTVSNATGSAASAPRLSLELPALRLGFHGPTSCLHPHPARFDELRLAAPEPWSMDADLYPPATTLRLSAWAPIRFISY